MSLRRLLLVPALLVPMGALAAEVTEMPPALRGDVGIGYAGTFGFGGIEEEGEVYAKTKLQRHDDKRFVDTTECNDAGALRRRLATRRHS